MKVSLFKNAKDTSAVGTLDIKDFLLDIKNGRWKKHIDAIRNETNVINKKALKEKLECVTISGTFRIRKQDKLLEHSGFICVDVDNFNDKSELINDQFTFALFKSASGNGIAIIVKINPNKHKESYNWLADYYFSKYGIIVDPAPKNVASCRFVSYDSDIYINDRSLKAKYKEEPKKKPQTIPYFIPESKFESLIKELADRGINIAESYEDYRNIGFALSSEFGEAGRNYFHIIASQSLKYKQNHADRQYDYCLAARGTTSKQITIGTLYYLMKQNGIELPDNDRKAITKAVLSKNKGKLQIKKDLISDGVAEKEAESIADYVEKNNIEPKQLATNQREFLQALIDFLRINYPIRINEITRMPEMNGVELKKEQMNSIYIQSRMYFSSKEITKDIIESIVFSDTTPVFNPIHDFIESNEVVESGQIDLLVKTIKTDTPNADVFIKKWLIGMIATAYGEPVRLVLSLVGGQNTGKTEWFRRLLPSELKKYYAESRLDAGKDDEILMTQKLIVMDDEMGGKSKQDEKRFKELTSKSVFSLRPPYGKHNEDFKRLAILCGTSNDTQIINDPTGNTRILPVEVISIDHNLYNTIDKTKLFMECVALYRKGEKWQMTKEELDRLEIVSSDHETINFEKELICKYFKIGLDTMTSTDIKSKIEELSGQKINNLRRFGVALKSIFGKSKCIKHNGFVKKVYMVELVTGQGYHYDDVELPNKNIDNEQLPF